MPDRNEAVKKQAVGAKFVDDITAVVRQAERAADRFRHGRADEVVANPDVRRLYLGEGFTL